MKLKKVLIAGSIIGILGTSLYANSFNNGFDRGFKGDIRCEKPKPFMLKKFNKEKHSIMTLVYRLNLTLKQKKEIGKIKQDIMKNRITINEAFSKSSFDKSKYIKIMKERRTKMIESKALMIEKIYNVLTLKQKEQLKVLMDLKKEKMQSMFERRMKFDKNCYDRR